MRVIYQYDFNLENIWPADYATSPYMRDGSIYYSYNDKKNGIRMIKIEKGGQVSRMLHAKDSLDYALPCRWKLFEFQDNVLMSCGNPNEPTEAFPYRRVCKIFLNLDDGMKNVCLPDEIAFQYQCRQPICDNKDVTLSDVVMHYKSSRKYQCLSQNGEILWEEKHQGYRYTPFEVKNGCVIFGTAGMGGGLYCYDLQNGTQRIALRTLGTTRYVWIGDCIACKGDKGQLILVNPFTGKIIDELQLDGILTDESGIAARNNQICVVGFQKKNQSPTVYLIDCTELL